MRGAQALLAVSALVGSVLLFGMPSDASAGQSVTDLAGGLTATDLAQSLVGSGIAISNVTYTGDDHAAGQFNGMSAVGIDSGVVLSSGSVTTNADLGYTSSVLGPNNSDDNSGEFGLPGDPDLNTLIASGDETFDASVLSFDFVPSTKQITFDYVFGSDEYNEYVGDFNDVFGFFVNGTNCATIGNPAQPVSVNTINLHKNADLYRDNSLEDFDVPPIDTQMDGLTTVLTCTASVHADQTNHIKLAIADASDDELDSDVFIQAGSFKANHPPVGVPDAYTTTKGTALTVPAPGVVENDTDVDGDALTVDPTSVSTPAHGTVTVHADGGFTYKPAKGFSGTDSFTYKATDGSADSAATTVTITVAGANHPPVAKNGSITTPENTAKSFTLKATDGDSDPLTYSIVTQPAHGTLTGTGPGLVYTPDTGYSGPDSLRFKANDGQADSNVAKVSITVTPADNPPPVAADDQYTTDEDQPLVVAVPGVLENDTDPIELPLSAVQLTSPHHGSLTLNGDGSFRYKPVANYNGTDSFTYRAFDGTLHSSPATVTITVNPEPDPVVAKNDSYNTQQDHTLHVPAPGVQGNDSNVDGYPLTSTSVTQPTHGTLTLQANGRLAYTPDPGFSGVDHATYVDTYGEDQTSNTATIAIHVAEANLPPVASADSYTTREDTALNVHAPGVLGNDSDPNGDSLTAHLVSHTAHGTVSLTKDGSFSYVPDHNFDGTDTFTYKAKDATLFSAPTTVTITVTPVDDRPVARSNRYSTPENTTLTVTPDGVLGNDRDPDGNALSAVLGAGPAHGTLGLTPGGGFTYRPDHGYVGADSFTYRASDGTKSSAPVTVTIDVTPVTPPPPPSTTPAPPVTTTILPPPPTTPLPPVTSQYVAPPPPVPSTVSSTPPRPTPTPTTPTPTPTTPAPSTSSAPPVHQHHSAPPAHPAAKTSKLRLSVPSVNPGGSLRLLSDECPAGSVAHLVVGHRSVGQVTVGPDGRFDTPVSAPNLPIGQYPVTATCGGTVLTTQVALVYVTAKTAAPAARSLTVAAMFGFFVLLLGLTLRGPAAARLRRKP